MKIIRPTLLVNIKRVRNNISKMKLKVDKHGLKFRPHFKTHQSAEIGNIYREFGINSCTVSSLEMAEYFAKNAWRDITIAFPFNKLEIENINKLASEIYLNLLITEDDSIEFLQQNLNNKVGIFIEIDAGYNRSGIDSKNNSAIQRIVRKCNNQTEFKGFLTHSGNTYSAKSKAEIIQIHENTLDKMQNLKTEFSQYNPIISIGDTPSCSSSEDFGCTDEIRPGNFVYFDVMQNYLEVCSVNEIAALIACPVVSKNADRNEVVIYGGAIHLSKEFLLNEDGSKNFGLVSFGSDFSNPIPHTFVSSVSQEHGIIQTPSEIFDRIQIGDLLGIYPIHSCLTANLMKNNTVFIR